MSLILLVVLAGTSPAEEGIVLAYGFVSAATVVALRFGTVTSDCQLLSMCIRQNDTYLSFLSRQLWQAMTTFFDAAGSSSSKAFTASPDPVCDTAAAGFTSS